MDNKLHVDDTLRHQISELLARHLKYMDDRNKEGVMQTIHSQSPTRANTGQLLDQLFRFYRLKNESQKLTIVGIDDDYVYLRIKQKTIKLEGPEFRDNMTDSLIVCRKDEKDWKIWNTQPLEIKFFD